MADAPITEAVRSRRAVLAAAAGSAAALAVSTIRPGSVAAVAANMQTETDNATSAPTGVTNSADDHLQALFGHAATDGNGVEGTSVKGHGARGISSDTSDPATNVSNAGVVGVAGSLQSIPSNIALTGVFGFADASPTQGFVGAGVWGDSPDIGVIGSGSVGVLGFAPVGVVGETDTSGGIGVVAANDVADALALRVIGRAEFTRSGRTTIAAGKASKAVTLAGCTSSTLVIANLAASRTGRWVRAVVPASGKFTIYLNTSVGSNTAVAWIAFTNPSNHSG